MRYGIVSDIHGNLEALQAVLAKLEQERVDQYLCAGDIVGYGASPRECLQLLLERQCLMVAGNFDYAVAGKLNIGYFGSLALHAVLWVRKQLSDPELQFLGNLDLLLRIDDVLTVAHGTIDLPEWFDYIQNQQEAQKSFAALDTRVGFIGHSHIPMIYRPDSPPYDCTKQKETIALQDDQLLVNVGSVGQPRDENPRACYVIYDDTTGLVTIHRVPYDIALACKKIVQAGLPEVLAERLRNGW